MAMCAVFGPLAQPQPATVLVSFACLSKGAIGPCKYAQLMFVARAKHGPSPSLHVTPQTLHQSQALTRMKSSTGYWAMLMTSEPAPAPTSLPPHAAIRCLAGV